MAPAVDDLRVHRTSTPDSIESDLTALWLEAARDAPIARALMANLVVFWEHEQGARVDFARPIDIVPLDDVVRRHPSRVIVLHHSPDDTAVRAPIAAAVTVVIFGTDRARYGVEQIAVRSASAEASLPSIVRNLARGDVPTSVWWIDDLSRKAPLPAVVTMGRQLIYDSGTWRDVRRGVLALTPYLQRRDPLDLADLNWRRLTAMRQALVHAAETLAADTSAPGTMALDVRVTHRPGAAGLAWLLFGWLTSRLGESKGGARVRVEEATRDQEILTVSFGAMTATMNRKRVAVKGPEGTRPFYLAVHRESDADAVAAELASLSPDLCLHETLALLARHFG